MGQNKEINDRINCNHSTYTRVVKYKTIPATLLFIDFSKSFDSINRKKMKDILIIYGIPTEIIMPY